jgi:hypothetical protein
MGSSSTTDKLPTKVRILLGIFAIPSLFLAYMSSVMVLNGNYQEIEYFEWFYSLIGFLALFISVTGKRLF